MNKQVARTLLVTLVGIAAAILVAATPARPILAHPTQTYDLIPPASRIPAPNFMLTDVDGHPLTLSQYRGNLVLLDFWAVNCGGCKLEIPWYVEFDSKYKNKGLAPIGLDMYGESPAIIKPFMRSQSMNYPVAVGTDAIGQQFHVGEMPLTLLIDRQGRIALSHVGVVDKDAFEKDIQLLLQ